MKSCSLLGRCAFILFLSGCSDNRYVRWGKAQFRQVEKIVREVRSVLPYQSTTLYDGFVTVGFFDILWFNDQMKTLYLDRVAERLGCSAAQVTVPRTAAASVDLTKELVFYLVMTNPDNDLTPQVAANNPRSSWSISLCKDDTWYSATAVDIVTLEPELYELMGEKFEPKYRSTYRVKFDRPTNFADENTVPFSISLRSNKYIVNFIYDGTCLRQENPEEPLLQ